MSVVYDENELPQVGALNRGVNPTADSLVVGAGSMDFGGSHKHYAANKANGIVKENKNSSDAKIESEDVATTPRNRILDTWKHIQGIEGR